jgi:hypothetical protein
LRALRRRRLTKEALGVDEADLVLGGGRRAGQRKNKAASVAS